MQNRRQCSFMLGVAAVLGVVGLMTSQVRAQCDDMTYERQQIYPPTGALELGYGIAADEGFFASCFERPDQAFMTIIYKSNEQGIWEAEGEISPANVGWLGPQPIALRDGWLLVLDSDDTTMSRIPHFLLYKHAAPGEWALNTDLPVEDAGEDGTSVDATMGNEFIVVRLLKTTGQGEGLVYHETLHVFEPDVSQAWKEVWREDLDDPGPEWDAWGVKLAASDRTFFLGRPHATITHSEQGCVWVYGRDAAGQWGRRQVITSPEPEEIAYFGDLLTASDDRLFILEHFATLGRAFARADADSPFELTQSFTPPEPVARPGYVAMSAAHLVMSQSVNGTRNSSCGAAVRYDLDADGLWQPGIILEAHDNSEGDRFGAGIGASKDSIVILGPQNRNLSEIPRNDYPGSIYVFDEPVAPTPFLYNKSESSNQLILQTYCATPRQQVDFYWAVGLGRSAAIGCPGSTLQLQHAIRLGSAQADSTGKAKIKRDIPGQHNGLLIGFQAVDRATCRITNVSAYRIPN